MKSTAVPSIGYSCASRLIFTVTSGFGFGAGPVRVSSASGREVASTSRSCTSRCESYPRLDSERGVGPQEDPLRDLADKAGERSQFGDRNQRAGCARRERISVLSCAQHGGHPAGDLGDERQIGQHGHQVQQPRAPAGGAWIVNEIQPAGSPATLAATPPIRSGPVNAAAGEFLGCRSARAIRARPVNHRC